MTKQKPDPAAGASRSGGSGGGLVAAGDRSDRGVPNSCSTGSHQLDSAALRDALLDLHEFWLTTKAAEIGITETSGFAIVATGGLGRGELLPYSDLDLMLLHDNLPKRRRQRRSPRLLWYPLWDANIRLDHSVRTVPEALQVAGEDISAGLAMLEVRHIAGDADLSSLLVGGARRQWRTGIASRFDELVEHTQARWQRSGQIAHRAEPDLKTRPRRAARRPAAQRAGDRPAGRRLSQPVVGVADRDARRGAPGPAQRPHRTAPRVRPRPRNAAGPVRRRDRCGAAHRRPIRPGAHALRRRPHHQLLRRRRAAHRGERVAAPRIRRVAPAGAPSARRRRHRVRGRGDPGPRRPPRARSRPDPAGRRGVGDHRPADGGVDAEPARPKPRPNCARRGRARRSRTCW